MIYLKCVRVENDDLAATRLYITLRDQNSKYSGFWAYVMLIQFTQYFVAAGTTFNVKRKLHS